MNEDSISKVHARIRLRNGQYYLEDPGSSNGTFLQGRKISYEKLQNGHIIRMGRTSFRFEQELPTTQKLPPPNRLVYFLSAGIAFVIIAIALLIWKLG